MGTIFYIHHFASYQLAPLFASASSGTESFATCCICSVRSCVTCTRSSTGHSTISSSWTCRTSRACSFRSHRARSTQHCQLDDIRRRALNGRVERNALSERADVEVAAFELRQIPASSEQRCDKTVLLCLCDDIFHIGAHARVIFQIPVDIRLCFLASRRCPQQARTPKCRRPMPKLTAFTWRRISGNVTSSGMGTPARQLP